MTATLFRLAAELLDMSADEFSNHGCNDFKMTGRFDEPTRQVLAALINEDRHGTAVGGAHPDDLVTAERLKDWAQDWILMQALARALRTHADRLES